MTSLSLSLWIAFGIVVQLTFYLGVLLWRHWSGYQVLRGREGDLRLPVARGVHPDSTQPAVGAWPGFRTFRVERKTVDDAAQAVCSFYLVPEDGEPLPPFLPGQFLTFRIDLPSSAGRSEQIVRCYSLSDAPRPDAYRVTIKRVLPPVGSGNSPGRSSNYFHDRVGVGSLLQVRAPGGHFHIDQGTQPVVLLGSGIGITPLLSMVNWSLAHQPGREIWLFYGVRHGGEVAMNSDLQSLAAIHQNFHLFFCFSAPRAEDVAGRDYQHRGRVDIDLLRMQLPIKPYHFYICGPSAMLESLVPALESWGIDESRIHFEAFGPASIKRPSMAAARDAEPPRDGSGIFVNFALAGKQLAWPATAQSLLELAEANGIAVSSGCRAGGCGSCQTTVVAGEVSYRQAPDFDPPPGTCLLCVATPQTSLTLEA